MQSFFSSATAAATAALTTPISITLSLAEGKQGHTQWSPPPGSSSTTPVKASVFSNGEHISGEIKLLVNGGKRVDHAGVRVEVKGILDASTEKAPHEFLSLVCEVTGPGTLAGLSSHPFSFPAPDLPVESYVGVNARVRYVVRATVSTKGSFAAAGGQRGEVEFVVRNPHALPPPPGGSGPGGGGIPAAALTDPDAPILLEVGIEDCLHIEFQYARGRYHLRDVVTGRIDFKQLGIKLKQMEVAVVRKETVGSPGSQVTTSETLIKFQVMDGEPQVGDSIPMRVPLAALEGVLTPSITESAVKLLSVRYFLYLALADDQRSYFKNTEIQLWRKAAGGSA